eukprot:464529_1
MLWIYLIMLANPLRHLAAQQHHVEQLSLVSQQILQDAFDIINYQIGDQDVSISRLYQLQSAIEVHDWLDAGFQEGLLRDLDQVVDAVAAVDNCQERVVAVDDLKEEDNVARIDIDVIRDGRNGRPPYNVSMELMESLIEDGYTAYKLADGYCCCTIWWYIHLLM